MFLFSVFSYANEKAKEKNDNDAKINFNLANAYYRKGEYDKALDVYKIVLNNTKDMSLKSAALYNMGNSAYRKQDKDLALDYYKECLKINSSDMAAKHNIEFLQQEQQNKNNKDNKQQNNQNKDSKEAANKKIAQQLAALKRKQAAKKK